jgi:hypothetical protein
MEGSALEPVSSDLPNKTTSTTNVESASKSPDDEEESAVAHPQQEVTTPVPPTPPTPPTIDITHNPSFAIYWHPNCIRHNIPGHPEEPGRVKSILEKLHQHFPEDAFRKCNLATDEHILLFHDTACLSHIKKLASMSTQHFQQKHEIRYCRIDGDTVMMHYTKDAVYSAVGSIITAIDHVYSPTVASSKRIHTAYCVVRPPGLFYSLRNLFLSEFLPIS